VRTTITLDDDVMLTVKDEMRSGDGKSFKNAVNDLIRYGRNFKLDKIAASKGSPFKVRPFEMGVFEHLDYDNIGELLEEIEGPPHK